MKYMTQVEIVRVVEKVSTARGIKINQRSPQQQPNSWTYRFGPNKNSVRISYWSTPSTAVDEDILIIIEPLPKDSLAEFEVRLNTAIDKLISSDQPD